MSNLAKNLTLAGLRQSISKVKADIAMAEQSVLPDADVQAAIRAELEGAVAAFHRIKARIAESLSAGVSTNLDDLVPENFDKHERTNIALGGALASYGVDRFMTEALEQVVDGGQIRMTRVERDSRLETLRRELYCLELDEELLVVRDSAPRRVDCNTAAVLGVPVAVAEAAGLLGGEPIRRNHPGADVSTD